jgi:hypothetical protein
MTRLIPAAVLAAALVAATGCGAKKVGISGTVTRAGEKLTWPDGGWLLVIYVPEDRTRDPAVYKATADIKTSTYTVAAIPSGRYKVAVQQFDPNHMDALGGAYDPGHTTIEKEVTGDGQVIDIDVPKDVPSPKKGKRE